MFDFVEKFVVGVCSSSEKDHAVLKDELNLGRKTDILLKLISEMPTINQESGAVSALMSAKSLHSLVKALVDYSRSLSTVNQQDGAALLDRGVSFSKIMVEHDGIVAHWREFCDSLVGKLVETVRELDVTLEPCKMWKAEAFENLQQVVAKADTTILVVKGKRVTSLKEALHQAGLQTLHFTQLDLIELTTSRFIEFCFSFRVLGVRILIVDLSLSLVS